MQRDSRSLDRSLSGMDVGTGTDFLSDVILGFTSCGTLIITYGAQGDEIVLRLWRISNGRAEAAVECPLFMTKDHAIQSSGFSGSEAVENLHVMCPGRDLIVVHGWPELIPSAVSPTEPYEVGQSVPHYATVIPVPDEVQRGHECSVQVLHFQWEASYDPNYPPPLALRAFSLPRAMARLSTTQPASDTMALASTTGMFPNVLLQVCTGTQVSLVPLSLIRSTSTFDWKVELRHNRAAHMDSSCFDPHGDEDWVSRHRVLCTHAIANDRKMALENSECCLATQQDRCAVGADLKLGFGRRISELDCDEFLRSSVPQCLGHSHFELIDFFVLPGVPGVHTLPPDSLCSMGHKEPSTPIQQAHCQSPELMSDPCTSAEDAPSDGEPGHAMHIPVGDVASTSSLLIVTALIRAALSVKRSQAATKSEQSLPIASSMKTQSSFTAEPLEAPIERCAAAATQQMELGLHNVCPAQQHAKSLAKRLQATGIWQSPTGLYGDVHLCGTAQRATVELTQKLHQAANQSGTCIASSCRQRDHPSDSPPPDRAQASTKQANETVAVRSITLVAYLGSCDCASEVFCKCQKLQGIENRCSACRCPCEHTLARGDDQDGCTCYDAPQPYAYLLGYRHSSAQLNRAQDALKAASAASTGLIGNHRQMQTGKKEGNPRDGEPPMCSLKRSRVCMQPNQCSQQATLQGSEDGAHTSWAQDYTDTQTRTKRGPPLQQRLQWAAWQVTRWAAASVRDCTAVPGAEATHSMGNLNVVQHGGSLQQVTSPCCPLALVKH